MWLYFKYNNPYTYVKLCRKYESIIEIILYQTIFVDKSIISVILYSNSYIKIFDCKSCEKV